MTSADELAATRRKLADRAEARVALLESTIDAIGRLTATVERTTR